MPVGPDVGSWLDLDDHLGWFDRRARMVRRTMALERWLRRWAPDDPSDPDFPGWGIHSGAVGMRGSIPESGAHRLGARGVALLLGVAVVVALAGGFLTLRYVYMPLGQGSSVGPGPTMFVRSIEAGGGKVWDYCFRPDATFAWHVSLRNNGPLPITLLGGGQSLTSDSTREAFILRDLATYRLVQTGGPSDPASAPVLPPTTLAPGGEVEVWARYTAGSMLPNPTVESTIRVRFSTLGIERTAEVPLRDGVGIDGTACPSE
jgi:hypothetical protein